MLYSVVPNHEGKCRPTWINRNQVCNMLDGGVTGFFKLVQRRFGFWWRVGPEFHGIISGGKVRSTVHDEQQEHSND